MSGVPDFESKHERRHFNAIRAGHSGRIKWTASGIEECVRHLQNGWTKLAVRSKAKEWEVYAEILVYLRERHGFLKGTVHYYRMVAVVLFLQRHMNGLRRAGIVIKDDENYALWDDALFEAFARLPFTIPTGFRLWEVTNYVKKSKKPS